MVADPAVARVDLAAAGLVAVGGAADRVDREADAAAAVVADRVKILPMRVAGRVGSMAAGAISADQAVVARVAVGAAGVISVDRAVEAGADLAAATAPETTVEPRRTPPGTPPPRQPRARIREGSSLLPIEGTFGLLAGGGEFFLNALHPPLLACRHAPRPHRFPRMFAFARPILVPSAPSPFPIGGAPTC